MCQKWDSVLFSFSMTSLQTRCQCPNRSSYSSGSVCCGRYDIYVLSGINHATVSFWHFKKWLWLAQGGAIVSHFTEFRHQESLRNGACPFCIRTFLFHIVVTAFCLCIVHSVLYAVLKYLFLLCDRTVCSSQNGFCFVFLCCLNDWSTIETNENLNAMNNMNTRR